MLVLHVFARPLIRRFFWRVNAQQGVAERTCICWGGMPWNVLAACDALLQPC